MFSKITKGDGVRIVPLKSSVEINGKCADGILAEGFAAARNAARAGELDVVGGPRCGNVLWLENSVEQKYCRNSTDVGCILREDEPCQGMGVAEQ